MTKMLDFVDISVYISLGFQYNCQELENWLRKRPYPRALGRVIGVHMGMADERNNRKITMRFSVKGDMSSISVRLKEATDELLETLTKVDDRIAAAREDRILLRLLEEA